MNKLFIVMSHTLTQAQKDDFIQKYGACEFITLQDVNPELSKKCQQVDPSASIADIKALAEEAIKVAHSCRATHFYCTGQPTLAMWANLYADGHMGSPLTQNDHHPLMWITNTNHMICVESTTKRNAIETIQPDGSIVKTAVFQHVQWRNVF